MATSSKCGSKASVRFDSIGQNCGTDFSTGHSCERVASNKNSTYTVDQGAGKSSVSIQRELSPTLSTTHDGAPAVVYSVDFYNQSLSDKQPSLGVNCGMSTGRNGLLYEQDS